MDEITTLEPQTSRTSRRFKRTATAVAALALGLTFLGLKPAPTMAATGDAVLFCGTGYASYSIGLPFTSSGYYSRYWTSVDGGQWSISSWWLSYSYINKVWDGSRYVTDHSLYIGANVGGNHRVYAWEERYLNGRTTWINLGSCTTSSFFGGGLVFTTN